MLLALLGQSCLFFWGAATCSRSAGIWMSGVGKDAEVVKQKMEEKARTTGKAVEKVIDTVKPGQDGRKEIETLIHIRELHKNS